ncbi:MAG: hypothetical protein KGY69_18365 [Bacteroidales bacterium]|nr:hypothetical protein [Candidatus Cloacimonadota bacterium]MBS3772223.1 hypothetical protein [Bacteroidales bacterium]
MRATFEISAEELDDQLLHQIKKMFKGKQVTITISTETDDTTYLLSDPANKKHLLDSIASEPKVSFTADEFEKKVEELTNPESNSGE